MHHKSKVIVLILSFNGKHLLQDSISSYLANVYPDFTVTVIDNGSTDGTKEWVEANYPSVKLLRTEVNLKYSGGFNFGLKYAFEEQKADFVLITNNDVKADSKVISSLVTTAIKDDSIGFVTGKVYYFDKPNIIQTVGYFEDPIKWIGGHLGANEFDHGQYEIEKELPFSDDIFILVSRKVYQTVGGYDTLFAFQAEQLDWQVRSKKSGFKVYYCPKAIIWHKESMTIGENSAFKTYYNVRNTFIVRLKHKDPEYLKKYTKYYLKDIVILPLINNTLRLRWRSSFSIFRAFISAIRWGIKNKKIKLLYFL